MAPEGDVALTEKLAGVPVMTGTVVSITVTLNLLVAVWLLEIAVQMTGVTPMGKIELE